MRPLRWGKILDWKFVAAFTFMLLAVYVVLAGLSAGARVDELISVGHQHDAAASRQRDALLDSQRRLLRQFARLQHKQDVLLAYLRAQGISVPADLASTSGGQVAPRGHSRPSTSKPQGGSKPKPHQPKPRPNPAPQPAPQPDPPPNPGPIPPLCVLGLCLP